MVRDGKGQLSPQKTPDLLSVVDLNVTTGQPQMDSGQSTVSWGGVREDVYGFVVVEEVHTHRKKTGSVSCAFDA